MVDVYQAGAGTSHNMNANEVLANRAEELLGGRRGDVRARASRTITSTWGSRRTTCSRRRRGSRFSSCCATSSPRRIRSPTGSTTKSRAFAGVLKTGRTHLQDAVPITLGQEFGGFAANVAHATAELERTAQQLLELNLGATAVGTGLNAGDDYVAAAIAQLAHDTGLPLRAAADRFRVTQSMGDVLAYSGALRRLAVEVGKIASDLRLLSMGPRAGIAEIKLPAVQPGSSIMPGKVNPSVPEMVNQVCYQVIGCDATILAAADAGQLELNVMMPVIAWNALHASRIFARAMDVLQTRCVAGIEADEERARELLDRSTALATALSPYIGYAATAEIAKVSVATGRPIRDLVRERKLLPDAELDAILEPIAMTSPGVPGTHKGTNARASSPTSHAGHPAADGGRGQQSDPAAAPDPLPAGKPRRAGRSRPRHVAAARTDHGRPRDRRGKRRR